MTAIRRRKPVRDIPPDAQIKHGKPDGCGVRNEGQFWDLRDPLEVKADGIGVRGTKPEVTSAM